MSKTDELNGESASDPYSRFYEEELILRDHLAIDRTILANERTFLAYVRTALAVSVAGVSFIQFFSSTFLTVLGWIIAPMGVFTLIAGLMRLKKTTRRIQKIGKTFDKQLISINK